MTRPATGSTLPPGPRGSGAPRPRSSGRRLARDDDFETQPGDAAWIGQRVDRSDPARQRPLRRAPRAAFPPQWPRTRPRRRQSRGGLGACSRRRTARVARSLPSERPGRSATRRCRRPARRTTPGPSAASAPVNLCPAGSPQIRPQGPRGQRSSPQLWKAARSRFDAATSISAFRPGPATRGKQTRFWRRAGQSPA